MRSEKKTYETPLMQLCRFRVQEQLLHLPSVSENGGVGFDDNGPSGYNPDARRLSGE